MATQTSPTKTTLPQATSNNSTTKDASVSIKHDPPSSPEDVPAKPKKKPICHIKNKTGCQIIGFVQIFCAIAVLFRSVATSGEHIETEDLDNSDGTTHGKSSDFLQGLPYSYIASNRKIQLVLGCVWLSLGCILLTGIHLKMPVLLLCWVVVTWMILIITLLILMSLLFLLATGKGLPALIVFFVFLVPFLLHYLFFRTVSSHKKELIARENEKHPDVQFQSVSVEEDTDK